MGGTYDMTLKYLLDTYPQDLLGRLLGLPVSGPIVYLDGELQADMRVADALLDVPLAEGPAALVHLEVQTRYEPGMPRRMLDYAVRAYLTHDRPVHSWLIVLLPPAAAQGAITDRVGWGEPATGNGLLFRYQVVCVWDLDPDTGFQHPGLLPLVPLMRHEEPADVLLGQCAERLAAWNPPAGERENLLWCIGNLASLRYDQVNIERWLEKMAMIDTPLMQKLRAEGEARALLTVLTTRNLPLSPEQESRIRSCQDLETLEAWLRRAVTAASVADILA